MEFKINIVSEDESFAIQQSQSLKNWIEDDEDLDNVRVKQERMEVQEGEAGGALLAAIQVMVGAALEPVAKTIQVWLEERTKRSTAEFSIEVQDASGKKLTLNSKNIKENDQALIDKIISTFGGDQNAGNNTTV